MRPQHWVSFDTGFTMFCEIYHVIHAVLIISQAFSLLPFIEKIMLTVYFKFSGSYEISRWLPILSTNCTLPHQDVAPKCLWGKMKFIWSNPSPYLLIHWPLRNVAVILQVCFSNSFHKYFECSCEIGHTSRWVPQNLIDDNSALY